MLYQDVRQIIETARKNAVHSVDFCRVQMYWNLGKRIFEEEQQCMDGTRNRTSNQFSFV